MSVKRRLTREREIPEYAGMVRRVVRGLGKRVADADPEDLPELLELRRVLDEAIVAAVAGQRRAGFSWAQIGRGLGVTRQAAQMTWGRLVDELEHRAMLELLAEHRQRLGIRPVYGTAVNDQDDVGALPAVVGR